jgi:hypothetical protein
MVGAGAVNDNFNGEILCVEVAAVAHEDAGPQQKTVHVVAKIMQNTMLHKIIGRYLGVGLKCSYCHPPQQLT